MEFNEEQQEIIFTNAPKCLVLASAACGKTKCIAARVEYLLSRGVNPEEIVIFSFTNMAAYEIGSRVGEKGVFVGTIHSYANRLLIKAGIDTSHSIKSESFDELLDLVAEHPDVVPYIRYLFLDEAQDTNEQELNFCMHTLHPANWMLVGDIKQSIFGFSGARPELFWDLSEEPDVEVLSCNTNYRCGRAILEYARRIIGQAGINYIDTSIPGRDVTGSVSEISDIEDALDEVETDPNHYGDWFILCRTNKEVLNIQGRLIARGIPSLTFKQSDLTLAQLHEKMESNAVKVLTAHSAKGLQRKKVIVYGIIMPDLDERCLGYVAATRAEDRLIWVHKDYKRRSRSSSRYKLGTNRKICESMGYSADDMF